MESQPDTTTNLTMDEKRVLFHADKFKFIPPPVCSAGWTVDSWIKWIDTCNGWLVEKENS